MSDKVTLTIGVAGLVLQVIGLWQNRNKRGGHRKCPEGPEARKSPPAPKAKCDIQSSRTEGEGVSIINHRSVQASAAIGVTLAVVSAAASLPVWLWIVWTVLTIAAIVQAARA